MARHLEFTSYKDTGAALAVELFGVAITVLVVGIALLVLVRDDRARRSRGERRERDAGRSPHRDRTAR